jgi:hypothetical protein
LEKSKQALTGFAWFVNGDIYFGDDASAMLPEDSSDSNITEIKDLRPAKGQANWKGCCRDRECGSQEGE